MTVKDLITQWERALAEAQIATTPEQEHGSELTEEDLEIATGMAVRSHLQAAGSFTDDCFTGPKMC
jgi:hypothetical protein